MKNIYGYLLVLGAATAITSPALAESAVAIDNIVIAQVEEEKGLFQNNSFFSRDKKEEKEKPSEAKAENKTPTPATSNTGNNSTSMARPERRERPDFANMSDEDRKAWREKRRAEIEKMRANMPPPEELTEAEKAERKAKREKRRAEIEKMRANMPPPKELTEAEKAERKATREKRRAEIEKMRASM